MQEALEHVRHAMARICTTVVLGTALLGSCAMAASVAGPTANVRQAAAQYNVVASLAPEDGSEFWMPLTPGADGLMYGISRSAVFRVEADGTITVLHSFTGGDGDIAQAPLTLGPDGWLYGTTTFGGTDGMGVIFKISTAGDFVLLHSFSKNADQGLERPVTPLVPDGQGGFYAAGDLVAKSTQGVIFNYSAAGAITILAQFTGDHLGRGPNSLVMGRNGVLYGTTRNGLGGSRPLQVTFFAYTPGKGLKTLYVFDYDTQGTKPANILVSGPDGALYGVMARGGAEAIGSVYRMTTQGVYSLVHEFGPSDPLGFYPEAGLAIDASGKLYGATSAGGKLRYGTIFSMTRKGEVKVLKALGPAKAANGYDPIAGPTWRADNTLWGLTTMGGAADLGTVFRIDLGP